MAHPFALRSSLCIYGLLFGLSLPAAEHALWLDSPGFTGCLHDNISNQRYQGSGFRPLVWKGRPNLPIYRLDGVGLNFEHIFNGAAAQKDISMFTPRQDACEVESLGDHRYQLNWPAQGSQWGVGATMLYDLSEENQIDLSFQCQLTRAVSPHGYLAMMWASYMHRTVDRSIKFWGVHNGQTGWVLLGEDKQQGFETGTIAYKEAEPLAHDPEAQLLNLVEYSDKFFITPFYYGLLQDPSSEDPLLYMVLFDQADTIRFAMWNFIQNEAGQADPHSPAWDWQFVIPQPELNQTYGYRARIVIEPFKGEAQLWRHYRQWQQALGISLPAGPEVSAP